MYILKACFIFPYIYPFSSHSCKILEILDHAIFIFKYPTLTRTMFCTCVLWMLLPTTFIALACDKTHLLTLLFHFLKNSKHSLPMPIIVLEVLYMLPSFFTSILLFKILQSSMNSPSPILIPPHQGHQGPWLKDIMNCFQSCSFSLLVNHVILGFT